MIENKIIVPMATVFFCAFITPSDAKIRCKEGYQTNSVGTFASPYCEDNYLARVARSYGIRVSNRTIRNNPNKKESVCRYIGHDSRVREICREFRGSSSQSYR